MKAMAQIWKNKSLRNKIFITIGLLLVYKFLTYIPLPGADVTSLENFANNAGPLGALTALTGGSTETFSIVLMGLSPYINASIIMQLLAVIIPKLDHIRKDGKQGMEKINRVTRWITLPLALAQSYGMILLLNTYTGIEIISSAPEIMIPAMFTVTAGTLMLMWIGELITEKGIGNGISLIIFASIVSAVPAYLAGQFAQIEVNPSALYTLLIMLGVTLALIIFVVWFTEAQRNVPVTYAQHGGRNSMQKSSLPLRVNQAGMIPIIFGVSMVTFPSIIAGLIFSMNGFNPAGGAIIDGQPWHIQFADFVTKYFNPAAPNGWYVALFFLLVIFFAYFYVSITFQPDQVAENIQKRGGFIPGVRPGKETEKYIADVSSRLTLWGGLCIALVAIFPYVLNFFMTSGTQLSGHVQLLISGAGVIIIVGVVLELLRQIKTEMVMKDYDKFY